MTNSSVARRGPKPNPDTRNKLLQAGLELFHADGYTATGIQGIVEHVDVPKGSFYNHYASKEAFAAEVIDAYFAHRKRALREMLCETNAPALERLKAYFDHLIDTFNANAFAKGCLLGNVSAEVADHSVLLREHLTDHFNSWSQLFETCIAEAQAQGTVTEKLPAAMLGRFVLNSWEGALLRMRAEKSARPLLEFKQIIFEQVLVM